MDDSTIQCHTYVDSHSETLNAVISSAVRSSNNTESLTFQRPCRHSAYRMNAVCQILSKINGIQESGPSLAACRRARVLSLTDLFVGRTISFSDCHGDCFSICLRFLDHPGGVITANKVRMARRGVVEVDTFNENTTPEYRSQENPASTGAAQFNDCPAACDRWVGQTARPAWLLASMTT